MYHMRQGDIGAWGRIASTGLEGSVHKRRVYLHRITLGLRRGTRAHRELVRTLARATRLREVTGLIRM